MSWKEKWRGEGDNHLIHRREEEEGVVGKNKLFTFGEIEQRKWMVVVAGEPYMQ